MKNLDSLCLKRLDHQILLLDQTLLPQEEKWLPIKTVEEMIEAIVGLRVRGAPAIGVAAALSLAQFARQSPNKKSILEAARRLREARPTAVNLMFAMDHLALEAPESEVTPEKIEEKAVRFFHEDQELCLSMARHGAPLIAPGEGVLTHCNTGGLATVGMGTALSVIIQAHDEGKRPHVFVDETRPLLQGGRLTTWELTKRQIPHTLICDNMAGFLMAQGKIHKIFVGADRIAANGDFANKIGTYSVAVLAHYHRIPFYVVAPHTTFDPLCADGKAIPIEQRQAAEVRGVKGRFGQVTWAPTTSPVYNPAFDVTPVELVTGLVSPHAVFSQTELKQGLHLEKSCVKAFT